MKRGFIHSAGECKLDNPAHLIKDIQYRIAVLLGGRTVENCFLMM